MKILEALPNSRSRPPGRGTEARLVKAVRDYERKFQHRQSVLDETARVLPTSKASAGEERAHDEKAALLRQGYADRERSAPDPHG